MPIVTPQQSSPNDTIEASDINNPINQLAAVLNGAIDSANLAANAVVTAAIADSAVTPNKLQGSTSGSWVWASWTPTWSNLTVGNGTLNYAKFVQIGKTVHFRLKFTWGSTTAITSAGPSFSLPVGANADATTGYVANDPMDAVVNYNDASASRYAGTILFNSTTSALLAQSDGSVHVGLITATFPTTWTTNDQFMITGSYEAA